MSIPTKEDLVGFEQELNALRADILSKIGQEDANYIKRIVAIQRTSEIAGRAFLQFSILPPFWLAGTALLSISKILDNMEIGHNVMHGQYDWMNHPTLHSSQFEWDNTCDGESWKRTHNYEHHTYTNILGKDRDYGYGVLRIDEDSPWKWDDIFNLGKFGLLSAFFQWGVGVHEMESDRIQRGEVTFAEKVPVLKDFLKKAGKQAFKDYLFFPALGTLTGSTLGVLTGNIAANFVRNIWSSAVIFCGHFPEGVHTFDEKECENESKGQWYYRQILGSCNFTGGHLMHVMSGHLSTQIEHHLFPDIPSSRYEEMSVQVKAICEKYGVAYNEAPFHQQYFTVVKKIIKNSFPKDGLKGIWGLSAA
jgi:NADPH-dependent stearoyl-CoA 9-desaturase